MVTLDTIVAALPHGWARVQRGSAMAGADGVSRRAFSARWEQARAGLERELLAQTYRPAPLYRFTIPKSDGSPRLLQVPTVRDRVAQSATLHVLYPIVDAELEADSFAYRRGRSVADAVRRLAFYRAQGYTHLVDADVDDYFDHVPHRPLLARLAALAVAPEVCQLIGRWLAADALDGDQRVSRSEGLPQGSPIAPLLANLYLDTLDETLMRDGFKLVRYADDFVVLARSARRAQHALRLTDDTLRSLALSLHDGKTRLTSFDDGFTFLGHMFVGGLVFPDRDTSLLATGDTPTRPALPPSPETTPLSLSDQPVPPSTTTISPAIDEQWDVPPLNVRETALGKAFLDALASEGQTVDDLYRRFTGDVESDAADALAGLQTDVAAGEEDLALPPLSALLSPGVVPFHRVLYVQEQGVWLRFRQGHFEVTRPRARQSLLSVSAEKVQRIVLYGTCLTTPAAIRACLRRGIGVSYCTRTGAYRGELVSTIHRDGMRQRLQHEHRVSEADRLSTARLFVDGRIGTMRNLLARYARRGTPGLTSTIDALGRARRALGRAPTLDALMGAEGRATARYFGVFGRLLSNPDFTFEGRSRRPPRDPVNALLSLGYTLVRQQVHTFVRGERLSPWAGFLHADRPGHDALVSDLLEEHRFLAERIALTCCNRQLLAPNDFADDPERGCRLSPQAFKTFIRVFEDQMATRYTHPVTQRAIDYRRGIAWQVRLFARHLEDKEPYVPFAFT